MPTTQWSKDQLKLAFHLYCQLPFGKLHSRNPEIVELAKLIGRTPSAVAMKLVNFASLDPTITSTGRKGLGNASQADHEVWEEFHQGWEQLAIESERLRASLGGGKQDAAPPTAPESESYSGESRTATVEIRIKQSFFRRSVLSSYEGRCCMSGIQEPLLLNASHIVPWSIDKENRLNPRNGLCLSALHDRAFDQGLLTVTPKLLIRVSSKILKHPKNHILQHALTTLDGQPIARPGRFSPDPRFLKWHAENRFVP